MSPPGASLAPFIPDVGAMPRVGAFPELFHMKIKLKLFATLRDYLPPESNGKEVVLELPDTATIPDALAVLAVPMGLCHIVMINSRHVLRPDVAGRRLVDGDQLAVFPAIGGG